MGDGSDDDDDGMAGQRGRIKEQVGCSFVNNTGELYSDGWVNRWDL